MGLGRFPSAFRLRGVEELQAAGTSLKDFSGLGQLPKLNVVGSVPIARSRCSRHRSEVRCGRRAGPRMTMAEAAGVSASPVQQLKCTRGLAPHRMRQLKRVVVGVGGSFATLALPAPIAEIAMAVRCSDQASLASARRAVQYAIYRAKGAAKHGATCETVALRDDLTRGTTADKRPERPVNSFEERARNARNVGALSH